jgi:PadR family transcriptional regulator PadR
MPDPVRITEPLLDVLESLVIALREDSELHGWAIMKGVNRAGPTVYGVLDRLEDAGWITGRMEERNPHPGRPPRRFYRLTPDGIARAEQILADRRPARSGRAVRPSPRPVFLALLRAAGLGTAR